MKRSQHPNLPKKPKPKPTKDRKPPVVPLVIWSNSAYSNGAPSDVQSSVASNSELLLLLERRRRLSLQERVASVTTDLRESFRESTKKKKKQYSSASTDQRRLICDEELRLREELGREIEEELERELMDGIMVLVRRLSELKAKQFLRDQVGEETRILRSTEESSRDAVLLPEEKLEISDAESRTSEVKGGRRRW